MTKYELINRIGDHTGLLKRDCEDVLDAFIEELKQCLIDGDKLTLKNFITFEITERPPRKGRNPKTGVVQELPAVKSVKCKVSKAFKDAVNERG